MLWTFLNIWISHACGAIQVLCNALFWKFDTHLPSGNTIKVVKYTFVMLFVWKFDTLTPHCINTWMAPLQIIKFTLTDNVDPVKLLKSPKINQNFFPKK